VIFVVVDVLPASSEAFSEKVASKDESAEKRTAGVQNFGILQIFIGSINRVESGIFATLRNMVP
jgi:hypothetical protein